MSTFDYTDDLLEGGSDSEYQYEQAPDEEPSQAVVTAVAEATGRSVVPYGDTGGDDEPDALPPLYEVIDPGALDAIVSSEDNDGEGCFVTFTYGGHTVTIGEQTVTLTPTV